MTIFLVPMSSMQYFKLAANLIGRRGIIRLTGNVMIVRMRMLGRRFRVRVSRMSGDEGGSDGGYRVWIS